MNGHGGLRPGAGRPHGAKTVRLKRYGTGRAFLLDLINDETVPIEIQVRGAIALLSYETRGLKAMRQEAITDGPFATPPPPRQAN